MVIIRSSSGADFLFETKGYSGELRVLKFTGQESLSRLFSFRLELTSDDWEIDLDAVVGKAANLSIQYPEGKKVAHGIVSWMEISSKGEKLAPYYAELVPEVWLLTRVVRSRIFQKMSVKDIVAKVLSDNQIPSDGFRFALKRTPAAREYCVQYNESDWNFVSRLMEEEGIFYFFEHKEDASVLVMGDSPDAVLPIASPVEIPFREASKTKTEKESVSEFRLAQEIRFGKTTLRDFNFTRPTLNLEKNAEAGRDKKLEYYEYPGLYAEQKIGEDLAKIRLEEYQALRCRSTGQSTCRRFTPGYKFNLIDHARESLNAEYLLVSVEQNGLQPFEQGATSGFHYDNVFTCIPASTSFRPTRVTPKPAVRGAQTAIVTGPKGEEIYTDEHGRVKVQFHWDREGQKNEASSCWIRISNAWAGKGWGAIYIPRIGQEVIVDFLEGDPDRPIITGRVYNGDNKPPYKLPDEKTKSTLKSDSSKGGDGFNEIRFEDNKGKEQIFIHAERNQDVRVKANVYETIGNERHLIVKKNQLELVEKDKHSLVKGDRIAKVEGDKNLGVKGNRLIAIEGNDNLTVDGDRLKKIAGNQHLTVSGNHNEKTDGAISVQAGQNFYGKAGMDYAMDAGMNVHIKGGMNVVIEAGMQLTIKAGPGFVSIGPSGVAISGPMVMINSGGAAGSGSGSSPEAPQSPEKPDEPKEAKEADTARPGEKPEAPKLPKPPQPESYGPAASVLKEAAKSGTPFCEH